MSEDPDDIMARWRVLAGDIEAEAALAARDPAHAALKGYAREAVRIGAPVNEQAGWLRAVARKKLGVEWKWEVKEMMGGAAALVLLSHGEPGMRDDPYGLLRGLT